MTACEVLKAAEAIARACLPANRRSCKQCGFVFDPSGMAAVRLILGIGVDFCSRLCEDTYGAGPCGGAEEESHE